MRSAIFRDDVLDDQYPAAGNHGAPAILQEANALVVRPIVQNELENVEIGTNGHGFEEVAADQLAAIGHTGSVEQRLRCRDHFRHVEEDSAQRGIGMQDAGGQCAASAADIGQLANTDEVIGRQHRPD